jgi:hypothetical protein
MRVRSNSVHGDTPERDSWKTVSSCNRDILKIEHQQTKNNCSKLALTLVVFMVLGVAAAQWAHSSGFGDGGGDIDFRKVHLITPSGGETFLAGTPQRIVWQVSAQVEYLKIEYSVNDGEDWIEIEKSLRIDSPADYYRWQVPCTLTDSAKVRLAQAYGWYDDVSLEPFSIVDRTPPAIELSLKNDQIWPPNGEMVDVGFSYSVSDNCDSSPLVFVKVTSDEPSAAGPASGSEPDAKILENNRLLLKAQRSDAGDGRVYVITLTATDASSNSTSSHVIVRVNLAPGQKAIDSGQNYDAASE